MLNEGSALIPPQAISGEFIDISVTTASGTETVTYTLTSKAFLTGHEYTLNIEVNSAAIGNTNAITGWTSEGTVNVKTAQYLYPGALPGQFRIDDSGHKVNFSQGNLQATNNGSSWTWSFAPSQWDYIGNAASNNAVNGDGTVSTNGTVDLFGWSTSATTYGIHNSTSNSTYSGDFQDWGTLAITNGGGTANNGWRTLSSEEWTYVFNTRPSGSTVNGTSNARYAHATIRTDVGDGVNGMILFPDGIRIENNEVTSWGNINSTSTWDDCTKCTSSEWSALAAKGCVFLPAAGRRNGTAMNGVGTGGYYWSSSPGGRESAYHARFLTGSLDPANGYSRSLGHSVRLVRPVE